MNRRVLIIGAGALGTALAKVIPPANADVALWDIDPAKVPDRQPLERLVQNADAVFMCVPSGAMRAAILQYAALLKPSTIVVSLAKGIEPSSDNTMDELCAEVLPHGQPFAIMGGAMLAGELAHGLPGMAALASTDDPAASMLMDILKGSSLRAVWVHDPHAVAVAGVLKNVFALALGISDGLGLGENARGWLFAQAVTEMLAIGPLLRADQAVLLSVAGIGDLAATGLSPRSKNHAAGVELARTGRTDISCEGIASFPSLLRLIGPRSDLPLIGALEAVLVRQERARGIFQGIVYGRSMV